MSECYRFDSFRLYPDHRLLWSKASVVQVGARGMDLLITLVRAAGRPVTRHDLTASAWPRRVVEPNNLRVQITKLRQILRKESVRGEEFIRNMRHQGYMFICPVDIGEEAVVATTSAAAPIRSLPVGAEPLSTFIGRGSELSQLGRMLPNRPLVTIVGMGGIGKTRLALRLGRMLEGRYPDGVVFVDLAPLVEDGAVAEATAAAVGVVGGAPTALQAVLVALQKRRTLIVLDNAEHVRESVGALVQQVLERCPGVTALVTSRESLGIPGEQLFRLQPLSLPALSADLPGRVTSEEALRCEAVQLFVDRAVSLLPDFRLDDGNASEVTAICRRLDGIALAIEMAAPRLQVLTPGHLSERLHDRFSPLAPGPRHALTRQRTLRTMFDWSWQSLRPAERAVMERLAVFAGGVTLNGLVQLEGNEPAEGEVLDALTALAQKSWLSFQSQGTAEPRYGLLETVRQYVVGQLVPGRLSVLRRRHAEWLAELLERADEEWATTQGARWLERYGPELDNLRLALDWAFHGTAATGNARVGDGAVGLRIVAASGPLWRDLPSLPLRESHRWHSLAAARIAANTPARTEAKLRLGLTWQDVRKGDKEHRTAAAHAVALFRRTDDRHGLAAALWREATAVSSTPALAAPLLDEAERILRDLPSTKWHALCLIRRADIMKNTGLRPDALRLYDQAMGLVRGLGYDYGIMLCGGNRAELLYDLGRSDDAIAEFRRLRQALPRGTRAPVVSLMTWHLALTGRTDEAYDAIREIVTGFSETGLRGALGRALEALALLRARAGDLQTAGRLLGCGKAFNPPTRPYGPRYIASGETTKLVVAGSSEAAFAELVAQGAAWPEDAAVDMALQVLASIVVHGPPGPDGSG